jgi:hypothetical protein
MALFLTTSGPSFKNIWPINSIKKPNPYRCSVFYDLKTLSFYAQNFIFLIIVYLIYLLTQILAQLQFVYLPLHHF